MLGKRVAKLPFFSYKYLMKQYRITSKDIIQDSDEDCVLREDDPIHEIKAAAYLGGLGSAERIANLRLKSLLGKKNEGK